MLRLRWVDIRGPAESTKAIKQTKIKIKKNNTFYLSVSSYNLSGI